jgi:3-dehydroquinate synthase/shikimate kinase/3-dehydroquinate synthase
VIVLVGFMGAGKTTVGRLLADKLGLRFADSDQVIEQRRGRSVREIFAEDGEAAFRAAEHEVLAELMRGPEAVVAVGGGAVENQASRRLLRAARVIYLQVGYDEAMRRVGGDAGRPLLRRPDLDDVYRRRLAVYQSVATLTVATAGRPADAVCLEVIGRLAREPGLPPAPGTRLLSLQDPNEIRPHEGVAACASGCP